MSAAAPASAAASADDKREMIYAIFRIREIKAEKQHLVAARKEMKTRGEELSRDEKRLRIYIGERLKRLDLELAEMTELQARHRKAA